MVSDKFEVLAKQKGFSRIAGIDEVGRGPLAGPVVAAACIVDFPFDIPGIKDSKQLTSKKRSELFDLLIHHPKIHYGVGIISAQRIDQINILQATFEAMREAVKNLPIPADYFLIDGNRSPGIQKEREELIIGGDGKSLSIAIASILAKVTRDQIMLDYHELYEQYGFDRNMGYPTEGHRSALHKFGPTPIHRKSFSPVRDLPLKH